jgi:tripartite-type tricarboxylate transporter receptor subunit TctC
MRHPIARCLAAVSLAALSATASAQAWPTKPMRLIVTFTTGGASDTSARIVAERLSDALGQQMVVENRPGGSGNIGLEFVKNAAPDGYTFGMISNTHAMNSGVVARMPFDLMKDFTYIANFVAATMVLVGNPAKTSEAGLADLTRSLKAQPGKYNYGSCGIATAHHFAMEIYFSKTGAKANHIPYKGCAIATPEVLSGQIELAMLTMSNVAPLIAAGKLRPYGVATPTRSPAAPGVPTFRESGIPELKDFAVENWYGIAGPAGVPRPIVDRISGETRRILALPDVAGRLRGAGLEVDYRDPERLASSMKADIEVFTSIAKSVGIKAE